MRSTISLGRIAGVPIGANWTWLVVVALIVWTLGAAVFPSQYPDLSTTAHWAMAAVATPLFFGSLLLHELGHALQGRRERVRIEGITLWLLGGVARLGGSYRSPGAELRIALAGPAVSAAIGAVMVGAALALELPDAAAGVVFWLGYVNLIILVFNLIPATPLDGGRVLHGLLWRLRGDRTWATRLSSGIGRGFGYLLVAGGAVLLLATAGIGGLWLMILGGFIATAARAEAAHLRMRESVEGLAVRDVMTDQETGPAHEDGEGVPTVGPDEDAGEAVERMAQGSASEARVVEEGRTVGRLSLRGVERRASG